MRFRFTLPPASACFRTAGKTHTPETCTFMFPGCGCFLAYIRFKMYGQIYGPRGVVIWCLILVWPRNYINVSAMLPRCFRITHQQLSRQASEIYETSKFEESSKNARAGERPIPEICQAPAPSRP